MRFTDAMRWDGRRGGARGRGSQNRRYRSDHIRNRIYNQGVTLDVTYDLGLLQKSYGYRYPMAIAKSASSLRCAGLASLRTPPRCAGLCRSGRNVPFGF